MNLLRVKRQADYVGTGYWSRKAIAEAARYCRVRVAASAAATGFDRVPPNASWAVSRDAAFCHITSIVIVREELLGAAPPGTPTVFDYKVQADTDSMANTPMTYAIYLAGLVFWWLKRKGGLEAMARVNDRKSARLYTAIERSGASIDAGSCRRTARG